jgi:D-alanyl-D-alanine carboxypeptidase
MTGWEDRRMMRSRRVRRLIALLSVMMAVSVAQTATAAPPSGGRVARTVRVLMHRYPLRSVVYGVWINGRRLVIGALGESQPGVAATTADHFRIGNTTESLTTTLLLQLVDERRVRLADPLSRWFARLPHAHQVTLGMLARSISGYADYVTSTRFEKLFDANPFRSWSVPELIRLAFSRRRPSLFAPGTSWAFSDTNFVLLGEVLRRVTGVPVDPLLRQKILSKLGLRQTAMRTDSYIPAPVMHAYTNERGLYEESTTWSPSWARYTGNMTSTVADMGRWATALGSGSLLSPRSHALQVGPQNVGLGPLTAKRYYGMGLGVTNGWIATNPQLLGYNGVVSYLPSKKIAVVVFTTQGLEGKPSVAYASAVYNRIAALLAPNQPPNLPVCPRPPC